MSVEREYDAVTVHLHGGSRDGATTTVHARSVEMHDAIIAFDERDREGGVQGVAAYKHHERADDAHE